MKSLLILSAVCSFSMHSASFIAVPVCFFSLPRDARNPVLFDFLEGVHGAKEVLEDGSLVLKASYKGSARNTFGAYFIGSFLNKIAEKKGAAQGAREAAVDGLLAAGSRQLINNAHNNYPNAFNAYRNFLNNIVPFGLVKNNEPLFVTLETFVLKSAIHSLLNKAQEKYNGSSARV